MPNRQLSIGACLIVKDEARALPDCLSSLRGIVDEVVVYDTGSEDNTASIARAAGAKVIEGTWSGDFAVARNAALSASAVDWVLSLDADERVTANPGALRSLLAKTRTATWLVEIHNEIDPDGGNDYRVRSPKLFLRKGTLWQGAVHEYLVDANGRDLSSAAMPASTLQISHHGYQTLAVQQEKACRNAAIAAAEIKKLESEPNPMDQLDQRRMARALLNLGRSQVGCGSRQEAVDTFDRLRRLAPGTTEWLQATDYLILLLLGDGQAGLALPLIDGLRHAGARRKYCDWLAGQALVAIGDAGSAWKLLAPMTSVVDTAGREYSPGRLHELKSLVAAADAKPDLAVAELLISMTKYGRVSGRGELLRQFWRSAGRADAELDSLARDAKKPYGESLRRELGTAGRPVEPATAAA